jgi:molecular chaperone Hsp33
LLPRLSGEYDCRLFAAAEVEFRCGCSAGRVGSMLRSLGIDEVRDIVREQGGVSVQCEFCRRSYRFDAIDAEELFTAGQQREPGRLN